MQMADEEQGNEGSGKDKEEDLYITERIIKEYTRKVNNAIKESKEAVSKHKEESAKEIEKLRKEIKNSRDHPIEGILEKWGPEIAKSLEEKFAKYKIEEGTSKFAREKFEQVFVEVLNEFYGANYKDFKEAVKAQERKEFWSKFRAWSYAAVVTVALGIAGYSLYESDRRTVKGAVEVSDEAKEIAEETKIEMEKNKSLTETLITNYNEKNENNNKELTKKMSGLEERLADKSDRTELEAKFVDLNKSIIELKSAYSVVNASVQGELEKNVARDNAYELYKSIVEKTKESLDEFLVKYNDFEKKVATREYADSEFTKVKDNTSELEQELVKYWETVNNLVKNNKISSENISEIQENYKVMVKRIDKIEEELKKHK